MKREIFEAKPDVILLSSEPNSFTDKYSEDFRILRHKSKVLTIDSELFLWYDSQMSKFSLHINFLKSNL